MLSRALEMYLDVARQRVRDLPELLHRRRLERGDEAEEVRVEPRGLAVSFRFHLTSTSAGT